MRYKMYHSPVVILLALCFLNVNAGFFNKFHLRRLFHTKSDEVSSDSPLPAAQWFTQRLDHFNDAETKTWKQRYFVNESFYVSGGNAFVMIGGEGAASAIWNLKGNWMELAPKFNAICFQLEHRFYGESYPTKDASVKNLQYLNSEQALADLALFRVAMTEKYKLENGTKWIFFGGSYSGSLAAWFRLKYPHLADGSVASSAPLRAEINFKEYLAVVTDSLSEVSSTCVSNIKKATDQLDDLLAQGPSGWEIINDKFGLCTDFNGNKSLDVANLYSNLCGNIEGVVQYNKDNRAFDGALATNITINTICDTMDDASIGPEIDRYAQVNSILLEAYNESCLNFSYKDMINDLRNTSWNSTAVKSGTRQWTYQTCTEFGFYQSSDLIDQPFGQKFSIKFWTNMCADIYGSKFNQGLLSYGVKQSNIIYGGQNIHVTKVIFPNGSVDPWHYLGILKDIGSEALAVYIKGTAHCADVYPSDPSDSVQLKEARISIENQIAEWINTTSTFQSY